MTFLSLVAFRPPPHPPPWLRLWVSTMPIAEAATVERAVHIGSVVIAQSCSPVSRLFHKNLQLHTLFACMGGSEKSRFKSRKQSIAFFPKSSAVMSGI